MSTPRTNFSLCRSTNNTLLYDTVTQFYALLYAVPTSILYGVAIYSIKQQASYYSPVYVRLLTLSMTLNLICWWLDFFQLQILGFWPWCPLWMSFSGEYFLNIPYYVLTCFPLSCLLCTTTISVYQMAVIVFPLRAEQRFLRHIKKVYALIVIVPMICCSHSFISQIKMMYFLSASRMYLRLLHIVPGLDFITTAFVNGIVGIVCFFVILPTSLISIVRYIQIRSKSNNPIKLRLFIINLYICLSIIFYITLQLFMFHARVVANDYVLTNRVFSYKNTSSCILS